MIRKVFPKLVGGSKILTGLTNSNAGTSLLVSSKRHYPQRKEIHDLFIN